MSFPGLNSPFPVLYQDSIWTGRSRNLGFVIKRPVAEKSPSHCTEVVCMPWDNRGWQQSPSDTLIRYHAVNLPNCCQRAPTGTGTCESQERPRLLTNSSCRKFAASTP